MYVYIGVGVKKGKGKEKRVEGKHLYGCLSLFDKGSVGKCAAGRWCDGDVGGGLAVVGSGYCSGRCSARVIG